ncbi:Inorganic pyrophosphatase 2 [Acorus gramineus]|uniref:Inorganic pyrophosphatase 2 n=1 Tax=Acorus gramineus TaxID=55184 RepID=A0AAV9BCD1_ACOGR|nr:Inorganic pyrophosphatase 2 [Acorus gramineus]
MTGLIVIFDFDKTIVDCDTDNWVVDGLGATALFEELLPTMPWNSLMDRMMSELHSQGKTIEDIAECLRTAPLHPRIISSIKTAHALGCELRVVSDANHFFIETILRHHGLFEYFSEINTNQSFIDEDGKLRIQPYHDFNSASHGCSNPCPPNMCKGLIIKRIQDSMLSSGEKRIIYLGDGKGDYCPSLRLAEGDFMMPRKNYPVWELITSNPLLLKAEIHKWSDAEEFEKVLLKLINIVLSADKKTPDLLSMDWKFPTVSKLRHGAFPLVLQLAYDINGSELESLFERFIKVAESKKVKNVNSSDRIASTVERVARKHIKGIHNSRDGNTNRQIQSYNSE